MSTRRQALVHGDYSPKHLLVDNTTVTVVDWEFAHWGDPRCDVAFVLTHLLLKAHPQDAKLSELLLAARSAEHSYRVKGPLIFNVCLRPLIGFLRLASFHSPSPVH